MKPANNLPIFIELVANIGPVISSRVLTLAPPDGTCQSLEMTAPYQISQRIPALLVVRPSRMSTSAAPSTSTASRSCSCLDCGSLLARSSGSTIRGSAVAARRTHNPEVADSNPARATELKDTPSSVFFIQDWAISRRSQDFGGVSLLAVIPGQP